MSPPPKKNLKRCIFRNYNFYSMFHQVTKQIWFIGPTVQRSWLFSCLESFKLSFVVAIFAIFKDFHIFQYYKKQQHKNHSPFHNLNILRNHNFYLIKMRGIGLFRYSLGLNMQEGTKNHCLGSNICPYGLIFCQ